MTRRFRPTATATPTPSPRASIEVVDPDDHAAVAHIGYSKGFIVRPLVVPEFRMVQLLRDHYGIDEHWRFTDTRGHAPAVPAVRDPAAAAARLDAAATRDEVDKEVERLARQQRLREGKEKQRGLLIDALAELRKPHLALYLAIFSVWWLMFPMLWDVLPKYIEDWVDTGPMVKFLFGADGAQSRVWKFLFGMDENGQTIQPEGIVNINAGMIMITCFLFAALSAKLRATTSMLVGTVLVIAALAMFGATNTVGFAVLAMIVFSVGEMLASPKFVWRVERDPAAAALLPKPARVDDVLTAAPHRGKGMGRMLIRQMVAYHARHREGILLGWLHGPRV